MALKDLSPEDVLIIRHGLVMLKSSMVRAEKAHVGQTVLQQAYRSQADRVEAVMVKLS